MWHLRNQSSLPWQERQTDMMIIVKVAAEFQGFSRDLHDEAAEFLANNVAGGNRAVADTIKIGLTSGRSLGRNNAGPDTLVNDFARIGLILWRAIIMKEPTRGPAWKADLKDLMERGRTTDSSRVIASQCRGAWMFWTVLWSALMAKGMLVA